MPSDLLTSLAIIRVNFDDGRDFIDNFVPFVAECLRTSTQSVVSVEDLQSQIGQEFGLKIPQSALQTILRRAEQQGYVKREERVFVRNDSGFDDFDFIRKRDKAVRSHEALVDKIVGFAQTEFAVTWTPAEATEYLAAYLEEGAAAILAAVIDNSRIDVESRPEASPSTDYIVASFIRHALEREPEAVEFLESVVKGSMLAGSLVFTDLGSVDRQFAKGFEVYFDTPFLLRALGLTGESRQAGCKELLDLLQQTGASLRVFEHTIDEIKRILDSNVMALKYSSATASGLTLHHFVTSGIGPSDIEVIIANLEESLKALRIYVRRKPEHSEQLTLDEARFEEILQEEVRYYRKDALHHDLDSITAIYRLRGGEFPAVLETSRAIFVTNNHALARATTKYFDEAFPELNHRFTSPSILDHVFGTIVWLKRPMEAPDLPRQRIIADCFAALNPPDRLWRRYLGEIDRLRTRGDISVEEYYVLRFSTEARHSLMKATLGEESALVEGSVREILDAANAHARSKVESELAEERRARQQDQLTSRTEIDEIRRTADAALKAAGAEGQAVRRIAEDAHQRRKDRAREFSSAASHWLSRILRVLFFAIIAGCSFVALVVAGFPGGSWAPALIAVIIFLAGLGVVDIYFGLFDPLVQRFEVHLGRWFEERLTRLID